MSEQSNEEIRERCAVLMGFQRLEAGSIVDKALLGMELICNRCRAVCRVTDRYRWSEHDSCTGMGECCWGTPNKLFRGVWIKEGKVTAKPNYTEDPAAALTLCDRMRDRWGIHISCTTGSGWKVLFRYLNCFDQLEEYTCEDPSLARAICLAFLAAHPSP